jgi:hypothetical protein
VQFSSFDFNIDGTLKVLTAGMVIHSFDCKTRARLLAGYLFACYRPRLLRAILVCQLRLK